MSSNIEKSDLMVDNRRSAWHGTFKNEKLNEVENVGDALRIIPAAFAPVETRPVVIQGTTIQMPYVKATYRKLPDGTVQPLGVVGENYEVLQNEDALRKFQAAIDSKLLNIETIGTLNDGKQFYGCMSFVKGGRVNILPNDPMFRCIVVMNSHDGQTSLKVLITNVRVVCGNTWRAALKSKLTEMMQCRHTVKMPRNLQAFADAIDYDEAKWKAEDIAALKHMTGVHINSKMAELYIKQTLSARKPLTQAQIDNERKQLPEENELENVRRSFIVDRVKELHETAATSATKGYRGSVYGWYQSLVEFLQYESGHDTKQFDARLYDQLNGENVDRLKLAHDNAMALCR